MVTSDLPLGLRTRLLDNVVEQLVHLRERCEEFGLPFEECFEDAEQRARAAGLDVGPRRFDATPIVLFASRAKVQRYHARNAIVEKLAARCVSWDIGGLALALGRSVRYVHSLLREESRTRIDPQGHSRVSEFRVSLRSWPTQG